MINGGEKEEVVENGEEERAGGVAACLMLNDRPSTSDTSVTATGGVVCVFAEEGPSGGTSTFKESGEGRRKGRASRKILQRVNVIGRMAKGAENSASAMASRGPGILLLRHGHAEAQDACVNRGT